MAAKRFLGVAHLSWRGARQKASVRGGGIGMGMGCEHERKESSFPNTHQALSLFHIDWSLELGGHWKAKVRGWLHERRVTEGSEGPGEVRPSVFRLRHVRFSVGVGHLLVEGRVVERRGNVKKVKNQKKEGIYEEVRKVKTKNPDLQNIQVP